MATVAERDRPVVVRPGAFPGQYRPTSCDHDRQSGRKLGAYAPGKDVLQYVCGKYTNTRAVTECPGTGDGSAYSSSVSSELPTYPLTFP